MADSIAKFTTAGEIAFLSRNLKGDTLDQAFKGEL
jgi:hypothetical protein